MPVLHLHPCIDPLCPFPGSHVETVDDIDGVKRRIEFIHDEPPFAELVEGERGGRFLSDRQVALAYATSLVQASKEVVMPQIVLGYAEAFLAFLRADDNPTEA